MLLLSWLPYVETLGLLEWESFAYPSAFWLLGYDEGEEKSLLQEPMSITSAHHVANLPWSPQLH